MGEELLLNCFKRLEFCFEETNNTAEKCRSLMRIRIYLNLMGMCMSASTLTRGKDEHEPVHKKTRQRLRFCPSKRKEDLDDEEDNNVEEDDEDVNEEDDVNDEQAGGHRLGFCPLRGGIQRQGKAGDCTRRPGEEGTCLSR